MSLPSLFEICSPRRDVREGAVGESDFAADLAQVVLAGRSGSGSGNEYTDPEKFFSNTHPTRGLKDLLRNPAPTHEVRSVRKLCHPSAPKKAKNFWVMFNFSRKGLEIS